MNTNLASPHSAPSTQHSAPRPWQFTGVVRLTKIGVSFVVFTIFAGFAAINTGNNALYIGLSFMLGGLLLSGMASKVGLKHLRVDFECVGEAWRGDPPSCAVHWGHRRNACLLLTSRALRRSRVVAASLSR